MENKILFVTKRSGAVVPFRQERIINAIYRAAVAVGGRDKTQAEKLAGQVIEGLNKKAPSENYVPYIEDIQDMVEKVLIENGHAKVSKAFILYRQDAALRRKATGEKVSRPSGNIPWPKLWRILDWAVDNNLHTIEQVNEKIRQGYFPRIVHKSEEAYYDDMNAAGDQIISRERNVRLIFVSGPSASGKTTTTMKIERHLGKKGWKLKSLNVDNYFYDLDLHPKDEFGDYDYETPQALDLEMINDHLARLTRGEEVVTPSYDFKTGIRTLNVTPVKLEKDEMLLIDSLHGLYPGMSEAVPNENKFGIYIEPLMQLKDNTGKYLRWTDVRLMRRMLRDSMHRGYNPTQTLEHWHYVRASELRNIVPYNLNADYIINSAMPYEIALYRPRLIKYFEEWVNKYEGDPLREDAYMRSQRILSILNSVEPVEDDSPVPCDSVLREFIGNSCLE